MLLKAAVIEVIKNRNQKLLCLSYYLSIKMYAKFIESDGPDSNLDF